jgi:MFS family permease
LATSPFAALKNRDFTLLITAGSLLLTTAVQAQETAIGFALYQRTRDPLVLGMIGLAEAAPYLIVALYGGAIADRRSRKGILLIAILGMLVGSVALDLLLGEGLGASRLSTSALLTAVYAQVALIGFARGFYGPAASALRASLIRTEDFANASAWSSAAWQTGAVIGPVAAGLLYDHYGLVGVLRTVILLMVISLVFVTFVRAPATKPVTRNEPLLVAIREGFRFVLSSRLLLYSIALDLVAVLFGGVVAVLPVFQTEVLKVGVTELGWLRASSSIGAVVTLLFLARFSPTTRQWRNLLASIAGFGLATLVFAFSTNLYLSMAMLFLVGAFDSVSVVIRQYLLNVVPPDHLRGRVLSVNGLFVTCSNEVGAFESGAAARLLGLRPSVVAGTAVTLGVVAWLGLFAKEPGKDELKGEAAEPR